MYNFKAVWFFLNEQFGSKTIPEEGIPQSEENKYMPSCLSKKRVFLFAKGFSCRHGGMQKKEQQPTPKAPFLPQTRIKHGCQLGWLLEVHEGMHVRTKNRQLFLF